MDDKRITPRRPRANNPSAPWEVTVIGLLVMSGVYASALTCVVDPVGNALVIAGRARRGRGRR